MASSINPGTADVPMPQEITWERSSLCGTGNCVEVARSGSSLLVRDSKVISGPHLTFEADEWRAFVAGVKAGEFDI